MESKDIEISKEIGQCLYDVAPKDTKIILLIAALSSKGDVSQFEFYSNNGVDESQFYINDADTLKLHRLASAHQKFMVANNHPVWTRCEFNVNVDGGKFSMDLSYEENAFRDGNLR